ncbi:hypothetical protein GCM10009668_18810 [Nocardioides dubius]|uniref:Uncharacterized protein n=1 Tax=Nocardioides dubius TaxID=317019 RepID=A0ABP4EAY8_9ACTN
MLAAVLELLVLEVLVLVLEVEVEVEVLLLDEESLAAGTDDEEPERESVR